MEKDINTIPTFIIAGAPKCGTTALWNILNNHPSVCMSEIKEPKFFSEVTGDMTTQINGDGARTPGTFNKGFQWYASLFKNRKPNQITGEASSLYICLDDAAEKIKKYRPDVKLIFILRHPAERTFSHYRQEYKLGFDFPPFEEMITQNHPRYRFYKNVSHYKKHLERFYSIFPKEQMLVLLNEDFRDDAAKETKKIFNFLGLDSVNAVQHTTKEYNEQVVPKSRLIAKIFTTLQQAKITGILPRSVRSRLYYVRNFFIQINSKKAGKEELETSLHNYLSAIFTEDIQYIRNLLNRQQIWSN